MKFNHFYLIIGIILITLSLSVFANAACSQAVVEEKACSFCNSSSTSSCSACTSGCSTTPSCPSTTSTCPKPVCGTTLNSCTSGTFFDTTDSATQYKWSCKDNSGNSVCCTLDKPCSGICGSEVNTCDGGNFSDVEDSDTQYVWECAGLSYTTTCTVDKPFDPCSVDLAPYILEIKNKSIKYTENFRMDLWDYVKDSDDFQSELEISMEANGTSVECSIESNRYLVCTNLELGATEIVVTAVDSCNKSSTSQFEIMVTNSPPRISVPNQSVTCTSQLDNFIDLYNYSADEEKSFLRYEVLSQSNPYFANCYVTDGHFLSCALTTCNTADSEITIRTTDVFDLNADSTFKISVKNNAPVWKSIPSVCISESKSKFIDLREYASDAEDKNNLTFRLAQSEVSGLTCSLVDSYYLSCTLSSNKNLTNTLDLNAIDSLGKSSSTKFYVSSNCSDSNRGSITFEAYTYGICLEKCSTYSVPITLKNDTNEEKCFDFDSKSTYYNELDTSLSSRKFCLNEDEETEITLTANSCSASERKYTVSVFDKYSDLSMDFKFEVGTCDNFDGFKVEEYDGTICKGERKEFSVLVKNTSSSKKKIYLSAENEMILPHFSEEYIVLEGRDSEYVSLTVNALSLREGDTEVVSISADADEYHIQKELYFEVVDCSEVIESTFSLSAPNICFDVRRGQTFESQFSIKRDSDGKNCSTKTKDFFLNIYGASSELSYNEVSLKLGESKTIVYSLIVPENLPAGKNYVTISASDGDEWNSFTETKDICLNVLPESSSSFFVRTQVKDIIWCGSNVFEVEVVNNGDLDETYSLAAIEVPSGVNVSFSEERFVVKKGQSKIIYVSVSTNPNSKVADNQKIQLKLMGSSNLVSTIYFNVKEKTTFDDIQILSATAEINMRENSSAPFDLVVRNNSEKDLNAVVVSIESLPEGVEFDSITIPLLKSGESMKVEGRIIANDVNGDFTPVFVVSSSQLINKRGFVLHIEQNEGVFAGMFAGLFAFGSSPLNISELNFGGIMSLVFLAIILIVLVWIITLGVLSVTKSNKQKEVWME